MSKKSSITAKEVADLEAAYVALKADSSTPKDERQAAASNLASVRRAFREQETAAGRRTGLAGGDVIAEET